MVKHSSSILKLHSLRDITSTGLQLPQLSCIILLLLPNAAVWLLITGAVLLAHPKYSLSHSKSLCTLYFVGNEASSSLVLHPCYIHNILFHTQFLSIFILFIMLSYTQSFSLFCS